MTTCSSRSVSGPVALFIISFALFKSFSVLQPAQYRFIRCETCWRSASPMDGWQSWSRRGPNPNPRRNRRPQVAHLQRRQPVPRSYHLASGRSLRLYSQLKPARRRVGQPEPRSGCPLKLPIRGPQRACESGHSLQGTNARLDWAESTKKDATPRRIEAPRLLSETQWNYDASSKCATQQGWGEMEAVRQNLIRTQRGDCSGQ
jgi:hypothetical protein